MGNSKSQNIKHANSNFDQSYYSKKCRWFDAAAKGDVPQIVQLLVEHPEFLQMVDAESRTALHHGAINGHTKLVTQLLTLATCDIVSAKDRIDWTALHDAASSGHPAVVLQLLAAGAQIDAADSSGRTPLHCAVIKGNESIVRLLVFEHANVLATDWNTRRTALHFAAEKGRGEIVALLLEASPSLMSWVDHNGLTALHVAVGHCQANVVKKMLAVGPITEAHASAVHLAVSNGFEDIADMLLQQCLVAAYTPDSRGNTLLHLTVKAKHTTLFVERVWRLNLDALRQMNHDRVTPFHLAIRTYNDRLVEMWQWGLTIDEILSDYGPYATRFKLVVEAQCEGLFQHLNQDVAGTVFEYFGFERPRGRY